MTRSEWNGFKRVDFKFQDREAILVFPNIENKTSKWMLKTEYFGAFPNLEIELLKKRISPCILGEYYSLGY